MFENPRTGREARNFITKVPKILDLKSSSEQIFFENPAYLETETSASGQRDLGWKIYKRSYS